MLMKAVYCISILFLQVSLAFSQIGKVGINTTMPQAMLHVKDSSVLFSAAVVLPVPPGSPPLSGNGAGMMWYADKVAFRMGLVGGTAWDKDSIGNYSVAMGINTKAIGTTSFASGNGAVASATNSSAFGLQAKASGTASFAAGRQTRASGQNSMAFGRESIASGVNASAIGYQCEATGNTAFALGFQSHATSTNSVAMGDGTMTVGGFNSVAMGQGSVSSGQNAVAMGYQTNADGSSALAQGSGTHASGLNTVAIGNLSFADHESSFAGGFGTSANQDYATSMGYLTSSLGVASHSFGYLNNALGDYATVFGDANTTYGKASFAGGHLNQSIGDYTVVLGENNLAKSYGSMVIGFYSDTVLMTHSTFRDPDDVAFAIGNGDAEDRHNSLMIFNNGNVGIYGLNINNAPQATLDVSGSVKLGIDGTALTNVVKGSVLLDPPNIPAGGAVKQFLNTGIVSVTPTTAFVSPEDELPDGLVISYAKANAGLSIEIKLYNASGADIDLPQSMFHFILIQ